ncbi:hypothetical protein ACTFIZ_012151 [Dictyostelium cf. discoideum]
MRSEAQVPPAQKVYYEELFQIADLDKDGVIGLNDASFFRNSMLSNDILRDIWQLSDVNNGYLNIDDFFVALKLVSLAQMGAPVTLDSIKLIPVIPPPKLNDIPPLKNDWIIGNSEKQNYIDLFNKYDEDGDGFILGSQAKTIFGTSGLPTKMLSHIWNLSDVSKDQKLDCQEFIMATFLIRSVLKGYELPNKLPESLITSSHYISSAGVPSPKIPDWLIPPPERIIYEDLFNKNQQGGIFTGSQAKVLFEKSGLSNQDLKLIWDLADHNQEQVLDKHKFVIAMFLISQRKKGKELPQSLPQLLLESSKSTFNPSSITSPPLQSSPQSSQQQPQQQQQQAGDSKYNINLNDLVSNTTPIGQPNIQPTTTTPATASGGLNVSGLISPPPQQQSPSIVGTPPSTITREGSFTFDNSGGNNLLAKPPRSNSITRMNSFQHQLPPQQQVSPQSTISNTSIGSGTSSFLSTNATTSSPPPPIPSTSSQPTSSNNSSITSNNNNNNNNPISPTSTNITQLFENIEKVKQQVFEQERIRQEEIQVKLNQELQLEAELKQQLSQEQQLLDEVKENVKEEEIKLSTVKADNQSLKEQISAARVDIKSLKSQLEQQSSLLREKSELFDEQNEALSHLNDDLNEKQQELQKNKQQIEQLLSSIESIKQNRTDVKNQISTVTKQLNDSKLELKQLAEEQKQQKQKLAEEQKQLQQLQQQQQVTSKSLTSVKSDDNITFLSGINTNTTSTNTATSIPTASVSGNDSWDFFNSPPVKSSSSLPTSPFDDNKTFVPTFTTNTTTTNNNNNNNTINTSNGNLTFTSPVKSTVNQLKSSNSSVGGTGGSVSTRKLSGASVSSNNSFNDNTSIDTLNNHFGSDQFSFNSFGSNNLTAPTTSSTTNKVQTDFFGVSGGNKDPFGGDSNNNPFGEESTSSIRDGGSETLSEAHTLFDKDPLFETNDAFQSSKDPFGQILFSNFTKDSFGGESVSNNNNNNFNSNISSITSSNTVPSSNFTFNTNSTTTNNRQSPIDSDLFSDNQQQQQQQQQQTQQQQTQQQQQPTQSNQNNQSFTSNDSFDDFQTTPTPTTTNNTIATTEFGVKFNDTTFGDSSNGDFDFGSNVFGQPSANDPFSSSIEPQQPDANNVSSDPFKGGFDDFGSAPFSFDNKFNEVVGDNSPSLTTTTTTTTTTTNDNDNGTFVFNNNNNTPSPFDS